MDGMLSIIYSLATLRPMDIISIQGAYASEPQK